MAAPEKALVKEKQKSNKSIPSKSSGIKKELKHWTKSETKPKRMILKVGSYAGEEDSRGTSRTANLPDC